MPCASAPKALPSREYESGGGPLAANATAVPAEGAAGIELFSATEAVATAKAEALEPWAEDEAGRGLEMAAREGATERQREFVSPLRDTPRAGVLAILGGGGTCQLKEKPPRKAIHKSKRPFEARKANAAGTIACPTRSIWPHENQFSQAALPPATSTYLLPRLSSRTAIQDADFEAECEAFILQGC